VAMFPKQPIENLPSPAAVSTAHLVAPPVAYATSFTTLPVLSSVPPIKPFDWVCAGFPLGCVLY